MEAATEVQVGGDGSQALASGGGGVGVERDGQIDRDLGGEVTGLGD